MSKKEKTEPTQLPEIVWHEPTVQWGYFEVKVPIGWQDFMGVEKVKAIAVATLNIVDAIKAEWEGRQKTKQTAEAEAAAEGKAEAKVKAEEKKKAEIQKIIDDEPDVVLTKRKEIGESVLNAEAAAAIIHQERQGPIQKPASPPKTAAQKAAASKPSKPSKPVDTGGYEVPPLPEGDFGEAVRIYKGEYGWSAYLDKGKEEDMIPALFEWLVSIPKEIRHRKGDKYPAISHSGKYIMHNDYEKVFIETFAERKGMTVTVKED